MRSVKQQIRKIYSKTNTTHCQVDNCKKVKLKTKNYIHDYFKKRFYCAIRLIMIAMLRYPTKTTFENQNNKNNLRSKLLSLHIKVSHLKKRKSNANSNGTLFFMTIIHQVPVFKEISNIMQIASELGNSNHGRLNPK